MDKNTWIGIVLGILVLISVVQAFQMSSLRSQVSSGGVSTAQASLPVQQAGGGGGSPNLPPSLQNLPDMVGGC